MAEKPSFSNIVDFAGLRISLASPEEIISWSYGEIIKPETINYRTLRPEKDGLFDERIFGPTKDWECYCGKYKRIRYRGVVCDKCGVEVTHSRVRRERLGHLTLAAPVAHVWFFKRAPSILSLILNIPPKTIEGVIYFTHYLVLTVEGQGKKAAVKKLTETFLQNLKDLEDEHGKIIANQRKKGEKEALEIKKRIKNRELQEIKIQESQLKIKGEIAKIKKQMEKDKETKEEIGKRVLSLVRSLSPLTVISEDEYLKLKEYKAASFFKAETGAEAIQKILDKINVNKLAMELREEAQETSGQKHIKTVKRLRIVEGFKKAKINPCWMIIRVLPVIPPDLRPMVQLSGGRFATSDLNDLYRRVINRNNRLKHLISLGAPEIILRNEKRMLQEAVDSLIESSPKRKKRLFAKKLRSLSDMLRGKQGRFRQNLLGKRVDYSGRSVIIVGPELKISECGLPKEMALEIFKPFVLRELIVRGVAQNVKNAKALLDQRIPEVFDILEEITKKHPVLLNRAPTLHKLGMQAFYPILVEGAAIRLHPCVCLGYNADFDGDQMAVHIPLSDKAKKEAVSLMMPSLNLLKPADGSPITVPNKGMALGIFYLTSISQIPNSKFHPEPEQSSVQGSPVPSSALVLGQIPNKIYDKDEAVFAWQIGKIALREPVKVRIDEEISLTSVGRLLFNEKLPQQVKFINEAVDASYLKKIVTEAMRICSPKEVARLIDDIKHLGFWAETIAGGVSVSVFDCKILKNKQDLIKEADKKVVGIEENYNSGLITEDERRRLSNNVWIETTEKLADLTWKEFDKENSTRIIIDSGGARASRDQVKQLSAMRGLVVDPLGKIVALPTKSNFREGLSIFEYVTSSRGSRKGLTDSALKTADAGYLTRRLIDVSHDAIIRSRDCQTSEGIEISLDDSRETSFASRTLGRVLSKEGALIDYKKCSEIVKKGVKKIKIRSPLTCRAKYGICQLCYGWDLGELKLVELGVPVGILAAQSIGEPGTQLTLRVKHAGGIVGLDVTQGLPRVEELFEARTPKVLSPISEILGRVKIEETQEGYKIKVKSLGVKPPIEKTYLVPFSLEPKVKDKQLIEAGQQLASGFLDIKEALRLRGLRGAQLYLLGELQKVYESQGIVISDKHFEVIIRKMSDKVRIKDPGDSSFLINEIIDRLRFEEENAQILAAGGRASTAEVIILGISQVALHTESWLSSASFENTSNVLTEAAVMGRTDKLLGLKENVIIGRLIPTTPSRAVIKE